MVASPHVRVCFGGNSAQEAHAFRHCDAVGLNRRSVRVAITAYLAVHKAVLSAGPNRCRVRVDGQRVEFIAYKFVNGAINVGRITPIRQTPASE